ncbi:MAG TPA: M56 family metallopeptidase, partial [Tepidisphaeraceae bacterium]
MNDALFTVVSNPMLERLGWTLVHSVWQCTLAALTLAVMLKTVGGSAARYVISCLALVIAIAAPIGTFVYLDAQRPIAHPPTGSMPRPMPSPAVAPIQAAEEINPASVPFNPLPWSAIVWIAGVLGLTIRHVGGWVSVQHLRKHAAPMDRLACFDRLMRRLGIHRAVKLAQSAHVSVPSVVGWLRPVVLMPYSALTGLSPMYMEALLAHELAHVRRHDYLVNLIQTAIETLLFYHPAVWWISRQVRQEREHCCDDLAVQVIGGDRRGYAEALAAMEQLRSSSNPLAMASNGGSLLQRIRRLAAPIPPRASLMWPAMLMIAIVIGLAACSQVNSPQAKAQDQPATAPPPVATTPPAAPVEPYPLVAIPAPPQAPVAAVGPVPAEVISDADVEKAMAQRALAVREQALENHLAELNAQLVKAKSAFADGHPAIIQAQAQIDQLTKQLDQVAVQLKLAAEPAPAQYFISGVGQSGTYALSDKAITLSQAIAAAKPPDGLNQKHVVVVHRFPRNGKTTELFGGESQDLANIQVTPGDVIMITDKIPQEVQDEAMGPHVSIEGEVPKP